MLISLYAKRSIADEVLLIDGTFETHKLGLTLLMVVGVTTRTRTFLLPSSCAKSEAAASFSLIFDFLHSHTSNTYHRQTPNPLGVEFLVATLKAAGSVC